MSNDGSGGNLDSLGRWLLTQADYRHYGLFIALAVSLLVAWRRWRYGNWASFGDCISLITSAAAILGGMTVSIVFLLTKPPAIELLPSMSLNLIGLFTPIVIFYYTLPRIRAVFLPSESPGRPAVEKGGAEAGDGNEGAP